MSSEGSSSPSLQTQRLFGAFLQDHGSGGERALGSFRDTGCITEPLLSNFCLVLRERKCFAHENTPEDEYCRSYIFAVKES